MVCNIIAKLKKIGHTNYESIRIEIPEKLNEKLKDYQIEILDLNHQIYSEAFIYVVNKNKEDIYSIRLNPHLKDAFKNSFERIFEFLSVENQIIKDNNLLTETIKNVN